MKHITLTSADIHCESCATSIRNTVGNLDGVESVDVDVAAQTVEVTFDEPATEQNIRSTMEDAGFDIAEQPR